MGIMIQYIFYIAADLIGISSETLNTAGGFQLEIGNESVIVVNFTYFTVARTTIHHELGHCIDDTLTYNGYMDENIWNSYNPLSVTGGSIYTDTYDLFGNYGDEIYAYGSNGEVLRKFIFCGHIFNDLSVRGQGKDMGKYNV